VKVRVTWLAPALALGSLSVSSRPSAPDLFLVNGKIFTGDATRPYVQGPQFLLDVGNRFTLREVLGLTLSHFVDGQIPARITSWLREHA
jgi:hypothetical protein